MTAIPLRPVAELFLSLGQFGLWVAIVGACTVGIALARNASDLAGGGSALWLTGTILSIALWYSGDLLTPLRAMVALPATITLGLVYQSLARRNSRRNGRHHTGRHEKAHDPRPERRLLEPHVRSLPANHGN